MAFMFNWITREKDISPEMDVKRKKLSVKWRSLMNQLQSSSQWSNHSGRHDHDDENYDCDCDDQDWNDDETFIGFTIKAF